MAPTERLVALSARPRGSRGGRAAPLSASLGLGLGLGLGVGCEDEGEAEQHGLRAGVGEVTANPNRQA